MVEFYTQSRHKALYKLESSYGDGGAGKATGYLGNTVSIEPKRDYGWEEIKVVDTETKDINEIYNTTEANSLAWRINPQHGVPFALAMGTDEVIDYQGGGNMYIHGLQDLVSEDYDLQSFKVDSVKIKQDSASSILRWFDGCKVDVAELSIDKGGISELSLDIVAQDSSAVVATAGVAYATDNDAEKRYTLKERAPYTFKDVQVWINGTNLKVVNSIRWKVDNQLTKDFYLDTANSGKIGEPVPGRRIFEFEINAQMDDATYYNLFATAGNTYGTYTGTLTGAILTAAGAGATATFTIDDGSNNTIAGNIPPMGIIEISSGSDTEYAFYWDLATGTTEDTFSTARGAYGMAGNGIDFDDGAKALIRGTICLILNKGTDAVGSLDNDGDEDCLVFSMWNAKISTFGEPIDVGGGIVEQTFLIRPTKCVITDISAIASAYI